MIENLQIIVLLARLSAGLALGLAIGYSVRSAVRQCIQSRQIIIGRAISPTLMLISAVMAIWFVPPYKPYIHSSHIILYYALGAYCLGAVIGFLDCPIHEKLLVIIFLDVSIFATLWWMFMILVFSNARMPLSEVPTYKWYQATVAACAFGWFLTIAHHCGLTSKWLSNLPILLSALVLAIYDVPQWLNVMRSGFVYIDMQTAFVEGIGHFYAFFLIWPISLALAIWGLIAAYNWVGSYGVVPSLIQLSLWGVKLVCFLGC